MPEAIVNIFGAPPVEGLGTAGGFKIIIEDRGNLGQAKMQDICDDIVAEGKQTDADS